MAYASKHGSTHEVADAVADTLRDEGLEVEVRDVSDVKDVSSYANAVIGSALYMGRIRPEARAFLKDHGKELAGGRLALFAMGPKDADEKSLDDGRKQLDANLKKLGDVEPATVAIFGGVIDPDKLHFPFSRMPASDARDWDAISAWAREVAVSFRGAESATTR
ncbi:MAG TPA: flavodoxin domain-containing protein [Thermoleophilaceae bacterium]